MQSFKQANRWLEFPRTGKKPVSRRGRRPSPNWFIFHS